MDLDLIQLSTGQMGRRATLSVAATPDPNDEDRLTMRASDASLDRDREVIEPAGWQLDNYRKNPVIQNAHQYGDILFTIGRAEKTWVENGALMQTWRFASKENPMARIARDLYRGKFLNAASVGFIPVKWEYGDAAQTAYRRRYMEAELIEVSAVPVPSNPNALVAALKSGAVQRAALEELHEFIKTISAALHGDSETGPRAEQCDGGQKFLAECQAIVAELRQIRR
jgi:HK97 family phage prohead protease